jgi:hypothetical protein
LSFFKLLQADRIRMKAAYDAKKAAKEADATDKPSS